jgi:Stress responsive A/B Barrel Domain
MIKHSVIFTFKSDLSNSEKDAFFEAADALRNIPDVKNFEILKQISPKNKFEYGIAMEFETEEQYQTYNSHPQHTAFVQDFWMKSVEDFLEIDFIGI